MVDPLSITASIITVIQLSSEVVIYISGVSGATKERKRLRDEIRACESILVHLQDDVEGSDEENTWLETIKALEGPNAPLGRLQDAFSIVKAKLEPKNGLEKAFTSLIWPFKEKEVDRIIATIEREKTLLNLAASTNNHRYVPFRVCALALYDSYQPCSIVASALKCTLALYLLALERLTAETGS